MAREFGRRCRESLGIDAFESREPFADVICKARLAELAVGRNIDPNLNLFTHDLLDGLLKQPVEFSWLVALAAIFRTDVSPKVFWPRKAADMGGQDPF